MYYESVQISRVKVGNDQEMAQSDHLLLKHAMRSFQNKMPIALNNDVGQHYRCRTLLWSSKVSDSYSTEVRLVAQR